MRFKTLSYPIHKNTKILLIICSDKFQIFHYSTTINLFIQIRVRDVIHLFVEYGKRSYDTQHYVSIF